MTSTKTKKSTKRSRRASSPPLVSTVTKAVLPVLEGHSPWAVIRADFHDVYTSLPLADAVITDPPYDAKTHAGVRSSTRELKVDFDPADPAFITDALLGLTSKWTLAFCSLEMLGTYASVAGKSWVRSGVWDRPDGAPQLSGDRPAQGAEGIAIMHSPGRKKWWGGGSRALWTFGVERTERQHPTQKPVALMAELIRLFTRPGDLVIDPFCGVGTTGVACLRLGRRFIGVEMNASYASLACERLRRESAFTTLAAEEQGQLPLMGEIFQPPSTSSKRNNP